jgi:hypothetical protein
MTLLWTWALPKLEIMFGSASSEMQQLREMWTLGPGTLLLGLCHARAYRCVRVCCAHACIHAHHYAYPFLVPKGVPAPQ